MASGFSDAATEAAKLAIEIGSGAADAISFAAEFGEELPFIGPVLKTLTAIREKVETVKYNREELKALEERCTNITASVMVKCRQNSTSEIDYSPLEDCVDAVGKFAKRCGRRGCWRRCLRASSDKDDISVLKARVDSLVGDLGLAGIATLEWKFDEINKSLHDIRTHLRQSPAKLADVPKGTPVRKSWHVERHRVTDAVLKAFTSDGGQRLVGLVGGSGSGKTTAASEIVRSPEVREMFSDGILWLTVNEGANADLRALTLDLACMVYEDVEGSVGRRPTERDDGAAYIKRFVGKGHGGRGLKCLVVADNVWEEEVVSKLLETGMWLLLSTRDESLVTGADGEAVGVDEMSKAEAESVLRKAAELSPEAHLPDDAAVHLVELCGHRAMDLAFVGRWSTVRGRQDRSAWADAADKVRAEIAEVGCDPGHDTAEDTRTKRRKAILRAGFEDLVVGTDDGRVQRLYLSLGVLPDGHAFTVRDAAVLLYPSPNAEDEAAVRGVLDILERWTVVLRSEKGAYRMHDAHSSFARLKLPQRGDVRWPALQRWVSSISTFDALRWFDRYTLKRLWQGVKDVGGDGWDVARPYVKALTEMDEPDPFVARENTKAVARFLVALEDWDAASTTWLRLLEVEAQHRGADHPYVLNAYENLADLAERAGSAERASEWREKARQALPSAMARMKPQLDGDDGGSCDGVGLATLAVTILKLAPENGNEAERLLRRSLQIREAKLGPEHVQVTLVTFTLHHLGSYLRNAGRLGEAEVLLRRCLDIKKRKVAQKHVTSVADTVFQLGVCVRDAGRLDEARALLQECLALREATLGPGHEQVADTSQELGVCLRAAGRLDEAKGLLERRLHLRKGDTGAGA